MNTRRPLAWLAVLAAVLVGCSSPQAAHGDDEEDPLTALRAEAALAPCPTPGVSSKGTPPLPDLTLPCLGGGEDVELVRLTGVPTVLNLWATWCGPCREELPAFQAMHAGSGDSLRVLGVVTQDPGLTRPLEFLVELDLHFANLVDDDGDLARELGARGLPATVFLSADGSVEHVYNGAPLTEERLRGLVTEKLRVRPDG